MSSIHDPLIVRLQVAMNALSDVNYHMGKYKRDYMLNKSVASAQRLLRALQSDFQIMQGNLLRRVGQEPDEKKVDAPVSDR